MVRIKQAFQFHRIVTNSFRVRRDLGQLTALLFLKVEEDRGPER